MIVGFIVIYLFMNKALKSQNLPEYQKNYDILLSKSKIQEDSFIINSYPLPKLVNANPSISLYPNHYEHNNQSNNNNIIICWCPRKAWKPPCMWNIFPMESLYSNSKNIMKSMILDKKTIYYDHMRYSHMIEDARLFHSNQKLYIIYCIKTINKYSIYYTQLYQNITTSSFYLKFPTTKLMIQDIHTSSHLKTEKNWSPFNIPPDSKEATEELNDILFVYSINPHCIVKLYHNNNTHNSTIATKAKVIYTTIIKSYDKDHHNWWLYGIPRGGTPCQLVDTIYGMKYLSFFHSHSKYNHPAIITWYIGAYLFDPSPPFGISYILTEPIYPKDLYDEAQGGWAYKAVDYIVYPLGFVYKNNTIFLSIGKNDNSGWIIVLDKDLLINNMKHVISITS